MTRQQTEAEIPAWTDLHLHPVDQEFTLPLAELPRVLTALGCSDIGVLSLHAAEDLWDAEDESAAPLLEQEAVSVAELPPLLAREGLKHVVALCAPEDFGFEALAADLSDGARGEWQVSVASLGWGMTSLPDPFFERTVARFRLSICLGGEGWPPGPDKAARIIPTLPVVTAACERLAAILGVPCCAHIAYADG